MVTISHEMSKISPSFSQPMRVVVDMSSLDFALVTIMICLLRFFRYRFEARPAEQRRLEPQPAEPKSQSPPPIPPFQLYITPPSTPMNEHLNRDSADVSSPDTAVRRQVEIEKKASPSSPRSFPLKRQSLEKAHEAVPPSPPPPVSSKKSLKSSASTKSDIAGMPTEIRSTLEDSAFDSFKSLCEVHGLLKRPAGLGEHDVVDGINDEATLLYVQSPMS